MGETEKKIHGAIADWLGDLVALETHVEEAMDRQLKLESTDPQVTAAIRRFHDTVRDSKQRAVDYQAQYGSEPGNPIIKAGSGLLGKVAGLIDTIREDGASKALRDDSTAYNLLTTAYTMMLITAKALDDTETQAFAEQGMRTYAKLVQEINHLLPDAVLADLKDNEDHPLQNTNIVTECRAIIQNVWQSTAS